MKMIVAVDENWAIGNKNQLLARIPADQKFFRTTTTGKVVIMGRKTLESFPGSKPLKNRTNIVITKQKDYQVEGAIVVSGIEEAMKAAEGFDTDDIYVIGGASIYEQMEPLCDTALVTKIEKKYEADTYFPDLDKMEQWKLVEKTEQKNYEDVTFSFTTYKKQG